MADTGGRPPQRAWYPWYWQDYRASRRVQSLDYIEEGLYRSLLDESWKEGGIPDEVARLAVICRCPRLVMSRAWRKLRPLFVTRGALLTSERLEAERAAAESARAAKVQAGRKGGTAKALAGAVRVAPPELGLAMPEQRLAITLQNITEQDRTGQNRTTALTALGDALAVFERAWQLYPKREGGNSRANAQRRFLARLRAGVTGAELLAGVERYAAYVRARGKEGTEYVKRAETFFGPGDHWRESYAIGGGGRAAGSRNGTRAAVDAEAAQRFAEDDSLGTFGNAGAGDENVLGVR
jgi:uncharacterized protein YdaU (DUF1376 family)